MGMRFTDSGQSVVIFSPITLNVNFVEFQKHQKIIFNYIFSMSAVHVCTI